MSGKPQRRRVLFTEGSSTSARQALYCLGPLHTIDILDPSPLCQCRFSRFVRRWYRCPSFSKDPEGYVRAVLERIGSGQYDVLFPTHEQVFLLSRFRDLFRQHVGLAIPAFEAVDRMMSKADFARLLNELGLPCPATRIVRCRSDLLAADLFPCYVKLDFSTAGQGVRLVRDSEQLRRVADEFEQAGWLDGQAEILIQQQAVGAKGGVAGIFQNGRLVAAHCCQGRAIGVGGSSMAQLSIQQPRLVETLEQVGRHLGWHGAMGMEQVSDPATGEFQLIECNPRIGETVNALLSGVNLCEHLVRVSLDEPIDGVQLSQPGVRSHQGFLVLTANALKGASRRELLAELVLSLRRHGIYEESQDELTRLRDDWLSLLPFTAVCALLLARPRAAEWLVSTTVDNYSLHQTAVKHIRTLLPDATGFGKSH